MSRVISTDVNGAIFYLDVRSIPLINDDTNIIMTNYYKMIWIVLYQKDKSSRESLGVWSGAKILRLCSVYFTSCVLFLICS